MKIKFYYLAAAMLLAVAGCQKSDTNEVKTQLSTQHQEVYVSANTPVTLKSPVLKADSYTWYMDGEIVSNAPEYVFQNEATGKYNIILETVKGDTKQISAFTAFNTISLKDELATFTLNSSNGIQPAGQTGYYWNQTYASDTHFNSGNFEFSHTTGFSGTYWDGFTVSNVYDASNFGTHTTDTTHSGSVNWIAHQWGCMDKDNGSKNFILGYWGYYPKDINIPISNPQSIPYPTTFSESLSNWVKIGDGTGKTVGSITVTNSPWAYYGCKEGDGFATPFSQSTDYLNLLVFPVYTSGTIGSPRIINLANFNTTANGFWGRKKWHTEPLNFSNVKYLLFQMRSSDTGQWGMNTAAYFCLSDITIY